MTLAVVVPTLNELAFVPRLLDSLRTQSQPAERLLVVDGGSTDGTAVAARQQGADVLVVEGRGRGGQVAAAVPHVAEEIVLVAHADMMFSPSSLEGIRRALAKHPSCPGGCLGHRFDSSSLVLRAVEWCDQRRACRGDSYGDQAQFFRRQFLEPVGGFPDQPIMEDVELSRRLRSVGTPVYLNIPVVVSARRFARMKWWRVIWLNWMIRRRYRKKGLDGCGELFRRYYRD